MTWVYFVSYESALWLWRAFMWHPLLCSALTYVLNCLLHINFDSRSLLHCYDAMICGLTWVYPVLTSYSICKPVQYSYGCDMPAGDSEWSKVYTSEVLKGYFTQYICWNLYYAVHTLPLYSLTYYVLLIYAMLNRLSTFLRANSHLFAL